ncbi:alpha-amylase family glycosyl hydrolase [Chitinophagaceae bacterium 26-R-25]|nr:alpha-amylase family glycosyl hydrolase [Chitinophagaceae bacterium 26-R-25]
MDTIFQPVSWIHSTNIYEVNFRQYTPEGTFNAFRAHLPRLKSMGVELLYFMPVTPISFAKRKGSLGSYYACSDYTSINPEFGTMEDFKALVKEVQSLGMKVMIDIVANHTGWDHRWTREHPEYYRKNLDGEFFDAHGWDDVIDLNYDNPDLRKAMIDMMLFWIKECDIDAFRCDMAMLVPVDFWKEARTACDGQKKLFWFAECEDIAYHEVFDATYTWKFLHSMEAFWRKSIDINGLQGVLKTYNETFPPHAFRAYFTSNHDENSHSGSEYDRMGEAAKAFAVLCFTWNGIPFIYSGQELPSRKTIAFFERDPIEWTGTFELNDFYKTLLDLKKRSAALRAVDSSSFMIQTNAADYVFSYLRKNGDAEVLVFLNLSDHPVTVSTSHPYIRGSFKDIFNDTTYDFYQTKSITIEQWGYAVLEKLI